MDYNEQEFKILPKIEEANNVAIHYASFYKIDDGNPNVSHDSFPVEDPRMCMHCRNTGSQVKVELTVVTGVNKICDAVGVYACSLCKETTVHFFENKKFYFKSDDGRNTYPKILVSKSTFPRDYYNVDIPTNIQTDFNRFSTIFQEAQTAEESGLSELAGMGYRKSIEFLVTDFLIKYPTTEDLTEEWLTSPRTTLKQKVDKLPNERLIKTGTAISYIGNDETHYSQQNPEYNIHDMKLFIKLLIKEVESEIIYSKVEDFFG